MKKQLLFFCAVLCSFIAIGQQQLVFTPAGATGQFGPSQAQVNTAYSSTPLNGKVFVKNGIQKWVVPQTGYYRIQTLGAQGFGPFGGRGASMTGEFILNGGDTLKILVGQKGAPPVGSGTNQYGGGGGSFVTTRTNSPLIISGGGGGSWAPAFNTTTDASTGTAGNSGANGPTNGAGGINGLGGATASSADGGGGLLGNGGGTTGGMAFVNGGAGGKSAASGGHGGFGGGGGASSWDNRRGGGGGGYSGGGAAGSTTTGFPEGGGGGSYNSGTNPVALAGVQLGDGQVIITPMSSGMANDLALVAVDAPKNFCAGTRNVVVTIQNFGTNTITTGTVNWRINGVAQTPFSYSGTLNSISGSGAISAQVTLGSYNFLAGVPYTIKVWTSLPNGVADPVNANDTMTVVRTSGLIAPTGLTVNGTTGTTASLSWNPMGGAGYVIEYGPVGFTLGTGIRKTGIGTSRTITGLNPTTNYQFYLADSCGVNDIGAFSAAVPFATGCLTTASGTYTINKNLAPSATNFVSFNQLAFALNTCGVSGPVVVNVAPNSGPYKEKVEFGSILGASAINTITINGNGQWIVDSVPSTTAYAAVLLNGTDYMTIDSVNIRAIGTSNRFGLQLMGGADYNTIKRCIIELDQTATSSLLGAIVLSESKVSLSTNGNTGNYNLFQGNTTKGGYYGIRQNGVSTIAFCNGNQFIDNKILDYYFYGVYSLYQKGVKINKNEIARPTRSVIGSAYGIYGSYITDNVEINDNWIHSSFKQATGSTLTFYGIYLVSSDNAATDKGIVANNLIVDNNSNGTQYLLYNSGSDNWLYYHNTIVANDPTATGTGLTRMFYQITAATGLEFKNNLMYLNRGTTGAHYMHYLGTNTTTVAMDNNAYFMPAAGTGTSNFGYFNANVPTFAAWQAVNTNAYDQFSTVNDPLFNNPSMGDYKPTAAYFNNVGANLLSVVPTDITGAPRTITPDPGAYEFAPPPGPDLSISSITQLGGATCGTSADLVVKIINIGTDTVLTTNLNYTVNGVAQTPIPLSAVFATGVTVSTTILNIPLSLPGSTTVVVTLTGSAPGIDIDPANNTASISVRPGYSGNLTVNSAGTPSDVLFTSFSALGTALSTYGVCGPVVVDVTPNSGPYSEQFKLNDIVGTSAINTVTINGNGATLTYNNTNSAERATVIFNGADWVTIDSLNIAATGTFGFGVSFTGNADYNTVKNSNITVDDAATSTNFAGVTISGSLSSATSTGPAGNYNTIQNNIIKGGYYGISAYGTSTDSLNGNKFIDNTVTDFYIYGIYNYYARKSEISGNDVSRPTRTSHSTFYGVYAYVNDFGKIEGNKVHDPYLTNPLATGTAYGIYAYQFAGTPTAPAILANNLIYNFNSNGTQYVFAPYLTSYAKVVHNTIIASDPNSTATSTRYIIYNPGTMSYTDFQNNIVYVNRNPGGTTYLFYQSGSVDGNSVINKNAYFAPSSYTGYSFGYYNGGAISTFNAWKNATNFDANSVFTNPYFVNMAGGNYTPQSKLLDGYGTNFTSLVAQDVNNVTRTVPVDVGAIEFTGAPCTGLSNVNTTAITATSGTVNWVADPSTITIEWGPAGFKQASITGTLINVPANATSSVISGLASNTCYDYYLTLNCTSTIPGTPPVMGPYTFCTACANGPLAGTYTIGGIPGPTNYPTLASAVTALNGCGISAPVVFNMTGGTHAPITLGSIVGSSATNTITFNGSANLGDSIVATAQTAAIDLSGAAYINFNGLYVENGGGNFVVWLHNGAKGIKIQNSSLVGSRTGTSTITSVVAATSSATSSTGYGDNANDVTISGCKIVGNGYGVSFNGTSTTSKIKKIKLLNNNFEDVYYYGVRMYYTDSCEIRGNRIPSLRSTTSYGMYLWYNDFIQVTENTAYANTYGIYSYYTGQNVTSAAKSSNFINNMMAGGTYGMYIYGNKYTNLYHNSIAALNTYGLYLSGSTVQGTTSSDNIDMRNNIIAHGGTNYAIYIATAPFGTFNLNYNLYYTGGTNLAYNVGTPYATLAAWKLADPTKNVNSISANPGFVSTTDFHIVGTAPNNLGDNSVGVLKDIDNDVRPASGSTIVDIGADEFTPKTADAAILDVLAPAGCGSAATPVSVVFQNLGLNPITSMSATVNVSGTITANLSANFTGNLPSLGIDTIVVGTLNTYSGATISLAGSVTLVGDQDPSNNNKTISGTKSYLPVEPQFYMPDTVCTNQDSAIFAAVPYSGLQYGWYANSTDTVPVATGNTYKFPVNGPNTWHLGYLTNADSLAIGYAGGNSCGGGNMFNITTTSAVSISGFAVSTTTAANTPMPVKVHFIANGTYVGNELLPAAWTLHETVNTVSRGMGNKTVAMFNNPLTIPGGTTYAIYVEFAASYTNGNGANQVITNPDMTVNLGVGLCGSFTGVNNPRVFNGSIYYGSAGCSNIKKVMNLITATDTAIASFTTSGIAPSFSFDASASTNATSYSWDFGDGSAPGSGMIVPHTYGANGTYTVVLTVTDTVGCKSTAYDTTTVTVNISLEENLLSRSLEIYPNPTQGQVRINFGTGDSEDAVIRVLDISGKEIMNWSIDNLNGKFDGVIDISKLADGVYILEITDGSLTANRRLIKN